MTVFFVSCVSVSVAGLADARRVDWARGRWRVAISAARGYLCVAGGGGDGTTVVCPVPPIWEPRSPVSQQSLAWSRACSSQKTNWAQKSYYHTEIRPLLPFGPGRVRSRLLPRRSAVTRYGLGSFLVGSYWSVITAMVITATGNNCFYHLRTVERSQYHCSPGGCVSSKIQSYVPCSRRITSTRSGVNVVILTFFCIGTSPT